MINILENDVINKIAAGEVIERPASVIKELIENALDAGADQIEVYVEDYGKSLIVVKDNGHGIYKDDLKKCMLRYATSKINNANDLFSINTLGFRGEALASIAAVSKMEIVSKHVNEDIGAKINAVGGKLSEIKEIGASNGTTVRVEDLFFNTPARLKFLKSDSVELKHIVDHVTRYALKYYGLSFKLTHNGHVLINSPYEKNQLNRIVNIYGLETGKQMIQANHEEENVKINGFVSKPSLLRSDKSAQSVYVNGRFVKDETVDNAIYDAFHTLLFVNRHPIAVLDIELNSDKIDVNVHPTKDRIKFENPEKIYSAVFSCIRNALKENELITDFKEINNVKNKELSSYNDKNLNLVEKFDILQKQVESLKDKKAEPVKSKYFDNDKSVQSYFDVEKNISCKDVETSFNKLPELKILGQLNKTYFLAETNEGLMIIDQHVVQERILYEKFMAEFMDNKVNKQNLVAPINITLSPKDVITLKENIGNVKKLGFDVEYFGDNDFVVYSVPLIFGKNMDKELLIDTFVELADTVNNPLKEVKEEIITRMACRASIKAGEECSFKQFESLLKQLDECELPYTKVYKS